MQQGSESFAWLLQAWPCTHACMQVVCVCVCVWCVCFFFDKWCVCFNGLRTRRLMF
jgi:hypothetical protein